MRPFKMIFKDYKITIRWLSNEIKQDIKSMFSSASRPETYIDLIRNGIKDYLRALKSIFTSPIYGLYWATTLFIFSIVFFNLFLQFFFGFLVIFAYIHLKLKTGEPLKDYKAKYFP